MGDLCQLCKMPTDQRTFLGPVCAECQVNPPDPGFVASLEVAEDLVKDWEKRDAMIVLPGHRSMLVAMIAVKLWNVAHPEQKR